jgi:hypothetical protein
MVAGEWRMGKKGMVTSEQRMETTHHSPIIVETEEESAPDVTPSKDKPASTSDYSLYKCQGCGQMVSGFDMENHVRILHGGEDQEFVRL